MTKLSPGPWKLEAVGGLRAVVDAKGHLVRTTWHWKETECHANAQAISAVPEMLEVDGRTGFPLE